MPLQAYPRPYLGFGPAAFGFGAICSTALNRRGSENSFLAARRFVFGFA